MPGVATAGLPQPAVDGRAFAARVQHAIDTKTKPLGSLGVLEQIAYRLALTQRTLRPVIRRPAIIVFAGDHGIAAQGVSPFPQAVTAQMVMNFLAGGAAINAFSRAARIELEVVDAGIATELEYPGNLVARAVARGTRDFSIEPAMTRAQLAQALTEGARRVDHQVAMGSNTIGFGEMGIANTSSAACLMSRLLDLPIDACVGRGTGLDDAGLAHKRAVLGAALAHHPASADPYDVLATFGGFEIAMMTGAYLAAAHARMTIVVDGFIATAALLAASKIDVRVLDYCVFAHASGEQGHQSMLDALGAKPLLSLGLRLGEGTGAALAMPLIRAAAGFLSEMASFESAGVSDRTDAASHEG
ncbi:nicotinate-nucleotide--dimethylbenzimidazole phosphoribosyltransferase [Pararobbsia silviterrae]|uniref:Nicotinate-nucleotide--dimethylbenzimidazole phosphoribosyltransferase n=2 Tax=Pararobbsia silviterrae TaxID=1792498 RepID=A0A494Y3C5_9BURK|nr:nicotinate-nucleotide--dimethylbenzimidazole phosphoribosyltransferase [Pararobbsia silviterrae]RKP56799.1 nicotinate-nucleotide--dimethylbenzimidazole phosphoribosyltransferase [Pararobbsia silviterrae]